MSCALLAKMSADEIANQHGVAIPNTAKSVHDRCSFLEIHDLERFLTARRRGSDKSTGLLGNEKI